MSEAFKLPCSSYDEIIKIIKAFGAERQGVSLSLDDVTSATGVPRTVVSGNNGFLVQIGLLSEGNKKAATELGYSLGRAYNSNIDEEIERIWKEVIQENDFLLRMISAVRIRSGMDRSNFINHIIYSSGQKETKQNRAGASAIIEILKNVNVLDEVDGKIAVKLETVDEINEVQSANSNIAVENKNDQQEKQIALAVSDSVKININIDCKVDEMEELSQKLERLIEVLK